MRLFALTVLAGFGLTLGAFGCSTPVAPIPAGAWSITFSHGTMNCNIGAHNAGVGIVSQDGATTLVTDGISDADVSCTVKPAGSAFDVEGQALKGGENLAISVKNLSKAATKDAPVQGVVGYVSPTTADTFTSPAASPCNFYFLDGTKESIAAGAIWVAFECPQIADPNNICALSGYAKFQNCDGTPPAN